MLCPEPPAKLYRTPDALGALPRKAEHKVERDIVYARGVGTLNSSFGIVGASPPAEEAALGIGGTLQTH